MLDSLYAKLGGLALLLGLLAGGYAWVHHRGAMAQQEDDQATIGRKDAALLAASQSLRNAAEIFWQINEDAEAQVAAAKLSAQRSQQVIATAQRQADASAQAAAAWRVKFKAAVASKPCAAMMEQTLCAAVFETSPAPSSSL